MSNISSVGSYASSAVQSAMRRPDPSKMAEDLFSKLDTKGQGYIEKSDLATALSKISSSGSNASGGASADDIFSQIDSDGDGKVTKDELSSSLQKMAEQMDAQFANMRMNQAMGGQGGQGGMGGMGGPGGMPPPPPKNDAGFTKEELSSQLSETGSSDSQQSSLISTVVNNFDAADTDGDGKVSFKEAMAYEQSTQSSSAASSSSSSSSSSSNSGDSSSSSSGNDLNAKVMLQIMRLMHAYGDSGNANASAAGSALSVSA
jgi:Ca2+-binding EF-hand superfamily protein